MTTYRLSLIVEAGLTGCKLAGPSTLPLILDSTREPGADDEDTVMPRCKFGLLGALPTEFLTALLDDSGTISRDTRDLGNESLGSSSGEDIKLGLSNTTGTLEKCSVGIRI